MEKSKIVLVTPFLDGNEAVQDEIKKIEDAELHLLGPDSLNANFSVDWCPCLFICSDFNSSVMLLSNYEKYIKTNALKIIVAHEKELKKKHETLLWSYKVTDIVTGPNINHKTVAHKAKIHLKTLLALTNEQKDQLRTERLIIQAQDQESKKKRSEIDYEVVDYLAVEKLCNKSLRQVTELEEKLEDYERQLQNYLIREVEGIFEEQRDGLHKNGLEVFAKFMEVPLFICKKLQEDAPKELKVVLCGILFNTVDLIRNEFKNIKDKKLARQILDTPFKTLFERYYWIADKFPEGKESPMLKCLDEIGIEDSTGPNLEEAS